MNVMDQFSLTGKCALVTGATKGLGRTMAEGLAEAGAQVAVVSRHGDEAAAVASEIADSTGNRCRGYSCDVTVPDQVDSLVHQALSDFAHMDILVNNAGINIRGRIDDLTLDEFTRVQTVNVIGPWLMCRALAGHMKGRNYGRVINMGSTLSIIALADRTPYASSKGAILQMTRALALEWASHGITVNAMLPGPFATEMNLPIEKDPEAYREFVSKIPLKRWGELDEIKGLAVFLASDASSFVTGAGITIDGGWTAY